MIAVLVGTRPELIKIAPILRRLKEQKLPHIFIHSNQHYSHELDTAIMADLQLAEPDFNLHVGSGTHGSQTGKIMMGIEEVFTKKRPSAILVHGDTNTTLAGALAAKKLHCAVGHIEAGLRSFDYHMPEEVNRILVDRISDILFAPTEAAKTNLLSEGIVEEHIHVTGNTVVDALLEHREASKTTNILKKFSIKKNKYILLTAHRAENVDSKEQFSNLISLIIKVQKKLDLPIVYPMHPRAEVKLKEFSLVLPSEVITASPTTYLEMLALQDNAALIMTDSGGIQEEAYILKKPLVTLRDSTERPETLSANFIIHHDFKRFEEAWSKYQKNKVSWSNQLGDGNASDRIVKELQTIL